MSIFSAFDPNDEEIKKSLVNAAQEIGPFFDLVQQAGLGPRHFLHQLKQFAGFVSAGGEPTKEEYKLAFSNMQKFLEVLRNPPVLVIPMGKMADG